MKSKIFIKFYESPKVDTVKIMREDIFWEIFKIDISTWCDTELHAGITINDTPENRALIASYQRSIETLYKTFQKEMKKLELTSP